MTAVNPVYMNPALASLVEFEFGAENTLESLDRVIVRWRSGTTGIAQDRFRAVNANSIQALARRLLIGPGWEAVGDWAFYGWSSALELTLPASLTSVGTRAFQNWSSALELTLPASLTSVGNNAFQGWSSALELTLPTSLTSVGTYAFQGWSSALELTLPASLTSVGNGAFQGWSSATRFTLEEGHTGQGVAGNSNNNATLRDWAALTTIDLPASLTQLGNYVTNSTVTALERIIVRATTPPTITTNTFNGIPAETAFYVPDASVDDYKTASVWSTYAERIHGLSELP